MKGMLHLKRVKPYPLAISFLLFSMILFTFGAFVSPISDRSTSTTNVNSLEEIINVDRVYQHIQKFASLGSRVTGYNGCRDAAQYILKVFEDYGLTVSRHEYRVVVPIEEQTTITVLSSPPKVIRSYTLWPNSIQTSPTPQGGVEGRLIYVGEGKLEDFDGKDVKGAIVLMDFNSGDNWLNAAKLGANAVVFLEPSHTIYPQCMKKFLDTPIHFPRLYVTQENALLLRSLPEYTKVKIVSKMVYKEVTAENVIGIVKGTKYPQDVLIVSSHYDSWSVVPAISYGANEAAGVAFMLELAKYIKEQGPLRTVWFVAFSGHWQALAGAREFVERYYFGPEAAEGTFRPRLQINIGYLASEDRGLQLLRGGHYSSYGTTDNAGSIRLRYTWIRRQIFHQYLLDPAIQEVIKSLTRIDPNQYVTEYFVNDMFWGSEAYPYLLDSEPAEIAGSAAITIATAYSYKLWRGTPLNDMQTVSKDRLKPQLITIAFIVNSFAKEDRWEQPWEEVAPTRFYLGTGGSPRAAAGYITLIGKVLTYNLSSGWYSPVPHALVRVYISGRFAFPYPFGKIITLADENGAFVIHGVAPSPWIPGQRYVLEAWGVDEETGVINYAPDRGIYGAQLVTPITAPLSHPAYASIVLMKGVPITIFDVIDPRSGRNTMIPDPRISGHYSFSPGGVQIGGWFYAAGGQVIPQEIATRSDFLIYGSYYTGWEPVAIVFVPYRAKAAIIFRLGGSMQGLPTTRPVLLLTNASYQSPEGSGFEATDQGLTIPFTAYYAAWDMYLMAQSRYNTLRDRNVRSLSAEHKLAKANELLDEAKRYYEDRNYSKAYQKSLNALVWAFRAYNDEVMPLVDDSGRSVLFFFVLMILSAIFIERLVIHKEGKLRLLYALVIGAMLLFVFNHVHPALTVMQISSMSLLGTLGLILFLFATFILAQETEKTMERVSVALLGVHRMKTGRMGIMATAFTTALENMRKRPLRTVLTLVTVLSTSLALTSLTSLSRFSTVASVPREFTAHYDGILIKIGQGIPLDGPMQPYIAEYMKGAVGDKASVFPRVWYYPPSVNPGNPSGVYLTLRSGTNQTNVRAALGISSEEAKWLLANYSYGIGFLDEDYYACILPQKVAEVLNVSFGDQVEVFGLKLRVADIIMFEEALDAKTDLDGFPQVPINPSFVSVFSFGLTAAGQAIPPPLSWRDIIVLPYKLALDLGGYMASVFIKFPGNITYEDIERYGHEAAASLETSVFLGWRGKVYQPSRISTFAAAGWEIIPALMLIGALNVTVALLGSVKERENEIFVYSSVGLSPFGASIIFIVESMVYAFLGSMAGYFLGFSLNKILLEMKLLPLNFTFNYASIYAIAALSFIMMAAIASSAYPAARAARMITPSLERKWKPPTKPRGDEWSIPLPIRTSFDGSIGLLEFLREYYLGAGAEKPSFSVRELRGPSFEELKLEAIVNLRPFEQGVTQQVTIQAFKDEDGCKFNAYIKRVSGAPSIWRSMCYSYIDDLRKQVLLWKSFSDEEQFKYAKKARGKEPNSPST